MLGRQAIHALKALLELASEPLHWRSMSDLAAAQELPPAMLEQLLLQLRRGGLLEARRGRQGGYRLARPAEQISLAMVLAALDHGLSGDLTQPAAEGGAADRVTGLLDVRLREAVERELGRCTLAELLFDLRSVRAELSEEGGLLLG